MTNQSTSIYLKTSTKVHYESMTDAIKLIHHLYDLNVKVTKPHHLICLTKEVKEDLCMRLSFLQSYNGKRIINRQLVTVSSTAHFYSDASKPAFGSTYGTDWLQGQWPQNWQQEDITVLKLYPVFFAINIFININ